MTTETKVQIRAKLEESRRRLNQISDQDTAETLQKYIEELEGRLLSKMGERSED